MQSHIGKYTTNFCQYYLVELFLKKACTDAKNLFYKNIVTTNASMPGKVEVPASCNATDHSGKIFQNSNFIRSTYRRLISLSGHLRNKVSIRKFLWGKAVTTNYNWNSSMMQHRTIVSRSGGVFGNKFTSTNTLATRTFATSSADTQSNYTSNYDFPVSPLPSKSVYQVKNISPPIVQNYMPFTITATRKQSEKVYRKIRNTCKSLVADLMYSFPFNTHSERTKERTVPKFNIGETRKNSMNSVIDKLSTKPRNSIWTITESFSFPKTDRRFDIETMVEPKEEEGDAGEISSTNSAIVTI